MVLPNKPQMSGKLAAKKEPTDQQKIVKEAVQLAIVKYKYFTTDDIRKMQERRPNANTRTNDMFVFLIREKLIQEENALQLLIEAQNALKEKGQITSEIFLYATDISPEMDALILLSQDAAERYHTFPITRDDERKVVQVVCSVSQPNNINARDAILSKVPAGYSIETLLSSKREIKVSITKNYRAEQELIKLNNERAAEEAFSTETTSNEVDDIVEENQAMRVVNMVLNQAINDGASDIHFDQSEEYVIVRLRQDGILRYLSQDISKSLAPGIISRIKIMSGLDIAEKRKPQDGRLSINHPKRGKMDFRVAVLPTVTGEKVIMRILDNSSASLTLPQLGFTKYNLARFRSAYEQPSGLILVTGPTGSGKSTTLYATLNAVTSPEINIITVEDPVEYKVPGINQVQVNVKAGLTFASALRSILRADPDIILIGEIRDAETAQIAIEAAQTGHLVLSTLHTNDAPSSYERLIDLGIDKYLVGSVTKSILAQRLARRLCNSCKVPAEVNIEELKAFGDFPVEEYLNNGNPIYEAREGGCKECNSMGYKGRMGIHEILVHTKELERKISTGAKTPEIVDQSKADGMLTLREDGWYRVLSGDTSIAEIMRVVAG